MDDAPIPLHRIAAIVPANRFARAKSRLEVAEQHRAPLATALVLRALATLRAAGLQSRFVVSQEAGMDAELAKLGVPRLGLEDDRDHSSGMMAASRHFASQGYAAMLMLSSDLPAASAEDVLALILPLTARSVVIGRSHDRGTNAIAVPLPNPIAFAFGRDGASCERHARAAEAAGCAAIVVDRPGLAVDLDTREDLATLLAVVPELAQLVGDTRR